MRRVLIKALSQIGVKELLGAKHNESILNYFESIGHKWVTTDETAWCSAFINWAAKTAGFEYTGKLNARSWLNIGRSVVKPRVGDVVIFWREDKDSWKGHVGLFISFSEDGRYIYTLGGNQSNMVCVSPYKASRVLGFRRLKRSK
jgi:uncharacterized protein (TIGR02594 family)